jgi:hypothetical protein
VRPGAHRPARASRILRPVQDAVAAQRRHAPRVLPQRLVEAARGRRGFCAQRDTNPGRFYPRDAQHRIRKFDDLPAAARANVDVETPFGGRPGGTPAPSEADVADVVAFLKTLTDER